MNRPALATAGTVLGLLLLLGGKAATSADPLALPGQSNVALAPTAQGTVTGPVIDTRYGPVQVRATVKAGQLTDVQALALPTGGRSGSISDYSAPILRREALAAQGAGIHAVSGATYTSEGYASSLQAALDQLARPGPVASSGQAGKG
jgi:uncharacterized protein with FMN-binding domain